MSPNEKIEARIIDALKKQEPLEPRRFELGGGLFYKCYWISCDEDIKRYYNFCPKCGQRIDWEGGKE